MKSMNKLARVFKDGAQLLRASSPYLNRTLSIETPQVAQGLNTSQIGVRHQSTEARPASNISRNADGALLAPLHELSDEEKLIKQSARRFAEETILSRVVQMDEEGHCPPEIVQGMFAAGLMGVTVPEQYGGSGASFRGLCEAVYEVNKADMGIGTMMIVQNVLVAHNLLAFGNDKLKAEYLPRIVSNNIACCCISEDGAGSDAFAMRTTAKKDSGDYIINGSKMWISNADYANVFLVFANVDPSKGYRGITLFVVERDAPGLTVGKNINKLGLRSSGTAPVFFENVRVPASNIVGEEGKAYKYAIEKLADGRICAGVQGVAVATSALDYTVKYLNERQQFGRKIWSFQAIQHQVCDALIRLESAKLLIWNSIRRMEAGLPYTKEACMAKYAGTEVNSFITRNCISWMGGVGFTKDFPIERFYRNAPIGLIYEGTSNVQLNTIAKFWEMEGFQLD